MKEKIIKALIILGSHFAHIVSIGMSITFGILYSEIRRDFQTSHIETAWIASIFTGLIGFVGLPLGLLLTMVEERWLTVAGTVLLSVGMFTSSLASRISTLYITYGLISGIGAGTIHYCANTIVVRHFSAKWCPLAVTFANSGAAVGSLVLPPILTACIQEYSWRTTFIILGGITTIGLFSAASFISQDKEIYRDSREISSNASNNGDQDQQIATVDIKRTVIEVLNNCKFMVFFISSVTASLVVFGPSTFLPDLMQEANLNEQEISGCVMTMGLGNLFGRILGGTVASGFNKHVPWVYGCFLVGFAATTVAMILANSLTSFLVLSALLGIFSGGFFGLYTAVNAFYLNTSRVPIGYGMITTANGVSITAGVPLAGFVSDTFSSEKGSFVFGGCVTFISALILSVNLVKEFCTQRTFDRETENEYSFEVNYESEITHLSHLYKQVISVYYKLAFYDAISNAHIKIRHSKISLNVCAAN